MSEMLLLSFEIVGTIAFAVSGALLGLEKQMDILGISILGLTTAVGGGVIRDLILGLTPPMTFRNLKIVECNSDDCAVSGMC